MRFSSTGGQAASTFFRGRLSRGRNRHSDGSYDDYSPSRRNRSVCCCECFVCVFFKLVYAMLGGSYYCTVMSSVV